MNKNAIKKFAIDARNKLIASVTDKAGMLGITAEGCSAPINKGSDFEVYKTAAGTEVTLNRTQCDQRRRLVNQIEARGFEAVIEEVAYTWFNRICAIRFMEVNDYIPVRTLSSTKEGKAEPDIVTQAPDIDELEFTDAERSFILEAKIGNKLDELFRMLFIKECHALNEILPELFEKTEDYTEMLLNISYTNEDDVVRMLIDHVDEADFNVTTPDENGNPTGQVEIIGWLYQYYNTELKDDTFAKLKKNVKISKERIPAATQLFTPDWIVRYMVENSVGRLWIEHLRAVDPSTDEKTTAENFGWKYYLPEAEQEESVNVKLAEIRTSYADLKPEDITCIDPCMGSGHILIAMFDVLMDIYKSTGYSEKEAAFSIVEHNIHGLDIDKRAYQLAYFAVMMKGRGYSRRFLRGVNNQPIQPSLGIVLDSNLVNKEHLKYFGLSLHTEKKLKIANEIKKLLSETQNASEYGSIINVGSYNWDEINEWINDADTYSQISFETLGLDETKEYLKRLVGVSQILGNKYFVCCTNPPYMGGSGMSTLLSNYVKENYPESKSDLFAVFIEKCMDLLKQNGFQAMITQHQWMFLAGFEKLRVKVNKLPMVNMAHLGIGTFEELNSKVVQSVAFVIRKTIIPEYCGNYNRLFEKQGLQESNKDKQIWLLSGKHKFVKKQIMFEKITGTPIAYWASDEAISNFDGKRLGDYAEAKQGLITGDNDTYMRFWYEVPFENISYDCTSAEETELLETKWYPYAKGGGFRRWYGFNDVVVDWYKNGLELKNLRDDKGKLRSRTQNIPTYFRAGLTWSALTTYKLSLRTMKNSIYGGGGAAMFTDKSMDLYLLGYVNSCVAQYYLNMINPTINFLINDILSLPVIVKDKENIERMVAECIQISKDDYDSFETSKDFSKSPLLPHSFGGKVLISDIYNAWEKKCNDRNERLKELEISLNEKFIQNYHLDRDLSPELEEKEIVLHKANIKGDVKCLISYAVGCILGRYSIDKDGLIFAGNEIQNRVHEEEFLVDDNIVPICDDEYLNGDIVSKFIAFLTFVYGKETLEENLNFIAQALGGQGNAVQIIRNYFESEFYADHLKVYQKKPVYWLFDSGKKNGFKCLIYMHHYSADIVGRIRMDYLHKIQGLIEQMMQTNEHIRDNSNNSTAKSEATKKITQYTSQLAEIKIYDEAIAHIANERIVLDLNEGVKNNYAKFQNVVISHEGKKAIKIDLLAPIK